MKFPLTNTVQPDDVSIGFVAVSLNAQHELRLLLLSGLSSQCLISLVSDSFYLISSRPPSPMIDSGGSSTALWAGACVQVYDSSSVSCLLPSYCLCLAGKMTSSRTTLRSLSSKRGARKLKRRIDVQYLDRMGLLTHFFRDTANAYMSISQAVVVEWLENSGCEGLACKPSPAKRLHYRMQH